MAAAPVFFPRSEASMPERGVFRNRWLPYLLVLPQVVITAVFFFWPAFRSLYLSFYRTDPFGLRLIYVGWRNFQQLFTSPQYHKVIVNTVIFSIGVTLLGLALSLAIAVLANQKIKRPGILPLRRCSGPTA
jgi:ABC-type sugar transport systems, permease components